MQILNASILMVIIATILLTTASLTGTSFAQKYSDQFKAQQNTEDHPCLNMGDPNMGTMVVQLKSNNEKEGASTDECLEYIDIIIEQYGYKMFDVISWGDDEYTWTLN